MKVLAIDSSGLVASVALVEETVMLAEYTINYKKTHSQTLLPMIQEIVDMTDTKLEEIDAIAVAGGPGSFTGLRIGSATAKGLGLALDKPIISVPTVDGLAYNFYGYEQLICPLMDARRNQVYTGIYTFQQERFIVLKEQCAVAIEEIVEQVETIAEQENKQVLFLGDGVPVHKAYIDETLKAGHMYAAPQQNGQRAGAVGVRAIQLAKEGKLEQAAEHKPEYLRLSQAERERLQRQELQG